MRILLQRVTSAAVTVDGSTVGAIDHGLVLLVGVGHDDTEADADALAEKVVHLRIFNDERGKFNLSLLDVDGSALVVSQFTLFADAHRGRRPNFSGAAPPQHAEPLCDHLTTRLRQLGVSQVAVGRFGAAMQVEIHNDGPVTVWLDSTNWHEQRNRN